MPSNADHRRPLQFFPSAQNVAIRKMELQNAGRDVYDLRHATVNTSQAPSTTLNITTSAANGTVYNGTFNGNAFYSGNQCGRPPSYDAVSYSDPRLSGHQSTPSSSRGPLPRHNPPRYPPPIQNQPPHSNHLPSPYSCQMASSIGEECLPQRWLVPGPIQPPEMYRRHELAWTPSILSSENEPLHRGGRAWAVYQEPMLFYSQ